MGSESLFSFLNAAGTRTCLKPLRPRPYRGNKYSTAQLAAAQCSPYTLLGGATGTPIPAVCCRTGAVPRLKCCTGGSDLGALQWGGGAGDTAALAADAPALPGHHLAAHQQCQGSLRRGAACARGRHLLR